MWFYEGMIAGLAIAAGFGPGFLYMMQTGIERGMRPALAVSLGIVVCDILLMLLALTCSGFITQNISTRLLGIAGGIILTGMGIASLVKPVPETAMQGIASHGDNYWQLFMKGFLINVANPFNFLFWVGLTTLAATRHANPVHLSGFLAGVLFVEILSTWLKCKIAIVFTRFITPRIIKMIHYSVGGIFLISGFYLFLTNLIAG